VSPSSLTLILFWKFFKNGVEASSSISFVEWKFGKWLSWIESRKSVWAPFPYKYGTKQRDKPSPIIRETISPPSKLYKLLLFQAELVFLELE